MALGAGEILLTSMDRDGTKAGYDIGLTQRVSDAVEVPVIASGGAGSLDHFAEVLDQGHASAQSLAASPLPLQRHLHGAAGEGFSSLSRNACAEIRVRRLCSISRIRRQGFGRFGFACGGRGFAFGSPTSIPSCSCTAEKNSEIHLACQHLEGLLGPHGRARRCPWPRLEVRPQARSSFFRSSMRARKRTSRSFSGAELVRRVGQREEERSRR